LFLQTVHIYDKNPIMNKNRWDDYYARQARQDKWLSRSVYKLEEIDRKFKLIHIKDRVLDLGCYPGSWSQYSAKRVGPQGDLVGIDLIRPDRFSSTNFRFIQGDILTLELASLQKEVGPRDVVLSDLAPPTTGIKSSDASRSLALAKRALEVAQILLKKKGRFLCKVFEGEDIRSLKSEASTCFQKAKFFRPEAVRKGSNEVYLVGFGFFK
jgi:23S rRNA (uridine2552-2'-O)-methyltransferase